MTVFVIYGLWLLLEVIDDLGYQGNSYQKVLFIVFKSKFILQLSNFMMASMQILVCVGNCLFTIELMDYIFCVNYVENLCN